MLWPNYGVVEKPFGTKLWRVIQSKDYQNIVISHYIANILIDIETFHVTIIVWIYYLQLCIKFISHQSLLHERAMVVIHFHSWWLKEVASSTR